VFSLSVGWPKSLWLVRHGESEGNLANDRAHRTKALRLEIDVNDIEIPLSETGTEQAQTLGRWLREQEPDTLPSHAVVSPYLRAHETARLILEEADLGGLPVMVDERLRDREQGVLDRLTRAGFRDRYPEEAERHDYLGKFWYRPLGGESWADVALRMRAALLDIRLAYAGERVLVVTHDVPILIARYVLEALSTTEAVALSGQVKNCSVTKYELAGEGALQLDAFNDTTALDAKPAAVTTNE
jgi:probable phosphoglycerate mutase